MAMANRGFNLGLKDGHWQQRVYNCRENYIDTRRNKIKNWTRLRLSAFCGGRSNNEQIGGEGFGYLFSVDSSTSKSWTLEQIISYISLGKNTTIWKLINTQRKATLKLSQSAGSFECYYFNLLLFGAHITWYQCYVWPEQQKIFTFSSPQPPTPVFEHSSQPPPSVQGTRPVPRLA